MNYRKWHRAGISDEVFMAKLGEEFGEVARAQSNRLGALATTDPAKRGIKYHTNNLIEELKHVEFIAYQWRYEIEHRQKVS